MQPVLQLMIWLLVTGLVLFIKISKLAELLPCIQSASSPGWGWLRGILQHQLAADYAVGPGLLPLFYTVRLASITESVHALPVNRWKDGLLP